MATGLQADPPQIVDVTARQSGDGWRFSVTLRHAAPGWDDYADGWRVESPDGTVLGTRVLAHPHVHEQPFTRSQNGIVIPSDLAAVQIRAKDSVGGWSRETTPFDLP
jgi:hypothetical protein